MLEILCAAFRGPGIPNTRAAWPYKERPVADQLANADARLAKIGIPQIVEHYKEIIRRQPQPPILIGHSFGGLIVQILLDQGYGAAGVAISSVPPRACPQCASLCDPSRCCGHFSKRRSVGGELLPPPEVNQEERARRDAQGVQMHLVPESGRIFWQLFGSAAVVDFCNHERPPLLLVGCGQDRCVPAETQRRNYIEYGGARARTDFVFFGDLTHVSIAEPGCETLAAYCAAWVDARLSEREDRRATGSRTGATRAA